GGGVRPPAEASENFDLITYEKGAAVVRMLERYLGRAAFRRGVRAYVRRHRESNAVAADLWRALREASGQPVEPLARAWIERPGHPVLEIRARRRGRQRARGGPGALRRGAGGGGARRAGLADPVARARRAPGPRPRPHAARARRGPQRARRPRARRAAALRLRQRRGGGLLP